MFKSQIQIKYKKYIEPYVHQYKWDTSLINIPNPTKYVRSWLLYHRSINLMMIIVRGKYKAIRKINRKQNRYGTFYKIIIINTFDIMALYIIMYLNKFIKIDQF